MIQVLRPHAATFFRDARPPVSWFFSSLASPERFGRRCRRSLVAVPGLHRPPFTCATCMPVRRTRTRARTPHTSVTQPVPGVIASSPSFTVRTRWADRSHPSRTQKTAPTTSVATGLPIEEKGVRYTIEHRDGRVFHKAARRDADGTQFADIEAEVRYALGSGTRGVAYPPRPLAGRSSSMPAGRSGNC
jgi:hypothetical protein